MRNGPRSKVTELLPIVMQSARILLLYSAGIPTDDFRVVIIGTPQGTSKDHEGPGDSTSPGPFHLLAMRTRSRALRYCTDPLVDCPLRLRCCWNPRVRRALSLHGRRSENDDAHPEE